MFLFAEFRALTRFEQFFFAIPYVIVAFLLPFWGGKVIFELKIGLILLAFFAARSGGIAINQLVDRKIDALNPRTKNRPIPAKEVSVQAAFFTSVISMLIFLLCALNFGLPLFLLALGASLLIIVYSYMKRVHFTAHFVMGLIHFLAPVLAYFAIKERVDYPPLILGAIAFFSISGNDIIYAMQDTLFDREHKLHSIPAKFGVETSLTIAKICHIFCLISIFLFGLVMGFPKIYFLALPFTVAAFYYYYLKRTFFLISSSVGMIILVFTLLSFLWRG